MHNIVCGDNNNNLIYSNGIGEAFHEKVMLRLRLMSEKYGSLILWELGPSQPCFPVINIQYFWEGSIVNCFLPTQIFRGNLYSWKKREKEKRKKKTKYGNVI